MEVGSLRFLKNTDHYIDGNRLNKAKTSVSLSLTVNTGSGCLAGVIRQEKKRHTDQREINKASCMCRDCAFSHIKYSK